MKKIVKIPLIALGVGAGLFAGTFTMYMLNLDMKMMALIEPWLEKWYDSRQHDFFL